MHKCINNSIGNVYHLEQFVSEFFPYSQKQLGFDKPVAIRFESDQDNAGVMLGKTAYYNPSAMEIALYVDGRHPKDIMRSLSHELVHHAQNCRGDFTPQDATGPGYAQDDPHMRKMEREAYTKGNLIFRDFEDLIKTGKINIEIDFSNSGEPKMSLNEWKNNELNTLLMKKWGLLKEEKNEPADVAKADDRTAGEEAGEDAAEDLEEGHEHGSGCGCPDQEDSEIVEGSPYRDDDDEDLDESHVDLARSRGQLHKALPGDPDDEGDNPDLARAYGAGPPKGMSDEDAAMAGYTMGRGGHPGMVIDQEKLSALMAADRQAKENPTPEYSGTRAKARPGSRSAAHLRGAPRQENQDLPRKISVREAKDITRRIIERIRKEAK
jgi:hypothetical protein